MNLDDLKVLAASVSGIGNWLLEIDILLKVSIRDSIHKVKELK